MKKNRLRTMLAVLLAILVPQCCWAATWYIHGTTGSDGNPGTLAAPWKSLAPLSGVIHNGDDVNIAGWIFGGTQGDLISLQNFSNVTIQQWAGQEQAWMLGYVPVPGKAWAAEGGGAWTTTITTNLPIDHVAFKYMTRITTSGRHYGFLKQESFSDTIAGCGLQGRWAYAAATGALTVHTLGGVAPGPNVGYAVVSGRNAIRLVECTNVTVRGLKFGCWPGSSQSQAVRRIGCVNCAVIDCEAHDCGSHSFADESRGAASLNNQSVRLRALGWNPTGTAYVTHSLNADIADGAWDTCSFVAGRYLGEDGAVLAGQAGNFQIGFYTHTSGGVVRAGGVKLLSCSGLEDEPIVAAMSVDNGVPTSDTANFATYPLQATDSSFTVSGRLFWATSPGAAGSAFRRCHFYFLSGAASGYGVNHGLIHEASDSPHLWEFSEIVGDTSAVSGTVGMLFSQSAGSKFLFRNCTLVDRSVNANLRTWFNFGFQNSQVSADGCLIAFAFPPSGEMNRGCWFDPGAGIRSFTQNAYINWSLCSQNGAISAPASWEALVDPDALFTSGPIGQYFPSLGNSPPAGSLSPASSLWNLKRPNWAGVSSGVGVNGLPDSGHYGAYQYGCYADCDAVGGLTANDFQCFLNRFAAGAVYANCDQSTATPALTANDFQCFLNAFAGGCQ